jgi:hypothetical protein
MRQITEYEQHNIWQFFEYPLHLKGDTDASILEGVKIVQI